MTTHVVGDDHFANTKLDNALTRATVDTTCEPFLVLDDDLRIIAASRSFYKKFKVSKAEAQGKLLYNVTGQAVLDAEKEKLSNEKDLMIREMRHRMANSLQLIASILILKSEMVESPEVRTHLKEAHERIMSIATVEKFLDTTGLHEQVEVGPYLTGLCKSLSASMIGEDKPIILRVQAERGMVASSVGIHLGLMTAELVMNCLKHAFPHGRHGSIVVTYKTSKDGWQLIVSDDGVGVQIDPLRKEGLGTTIVQSIANQMGAQVQTTTSSHGTAVSIQCLSKRH